MRALAISIAAPFLLSGCLTLGTGGGDTTGGDTGGGTSTPGNGDPQYQVNADQIDSTCGDGTLTLQASWSFTATLVVDSALGTVDYDNGQGEATGTLQPDGVNFSVVTTVDVNMRSSADLEQGLPPCTISRTDTLVGALIEGSGIDPTSTPVPTGFSGTLTYDFEPTEGSDCTDLLNSATPLVQQLPCGADYDIIATAAAQ